MLNFAIMLKSYNGDFAYAKRLVNSYVEHNKEGVHLFIIVPSADVELFSKLKADIISIIAEEDICPYLVSESVGGIRPGYINQEIVKLSFWEAGLCENYFCIDSDGVFVRDFYVSDFMFDDQTPYSILVEDNELRVEPEYYESYWESRMELIKKIHSAIGFTQKKVLTCHGFTTLSAKVLRSFKDNFLRPNNYGYEDILRICAYEFTWYNTWLQYAKPIGIHYSEPLFKTFHHKNQHLEYVIRQVSPEDVARGYLGIVVNSNYSRDYGIITYGQELKTVFAHYFKLSELIDFLIYKLIVSFKRKCRSAYRKLRKYV